MRRRTFLGIAGFSLSGAGATLLEACDVPGLESGSGDISLIDIAPSLSFDVLRREDMVALRVGFVGMVLDASGTKMVRDDRVFGRDTSQQALMIVGHQSQHILEEAFDEPGVVPPASSLPIRSRLSGTSRIAYRIPDDVDEIKLTVTEILKAAAAYEMVVGSNATPPDPPVRRLPPIFTIDPGLILKPSLNTVALTRGLGAVTTTDNVPTQTATNVTQVVRARRGLATLAQAGALDVGVIDVGANLPPGIFQLLPTTPKRPTARQTSIEVPYRLEISPNVYGQWTHALGPVESSTARVELWHTRLGVRGTDGKASEAPSYKRTIRALWTRDAGFDANNPEALKLAGLDPFKASLNPYDRARIVHQSSDFTLKGINKPFKCLPVDVNRLMLTSLGAWVDFKGEWENPPLDLGLWKHRGTMGRDHYVELQEPGYLYPWGHRAIRVTITERKLQAPDHPHIAYLRKRQFIIVKQTTLAYDVGDAVMRRQQPFGSVTFTRTRSPDLKVVDPLPDVSPIQLGDGSAFLWELLGSDHELADIAFRAPAVFVRGNPNSPVTAAKRSAALTAYNAYTAAERAAQVNGARVTFAPPGPKPDDTKFETKNITFRAVEVPYAQYESTFVPVLDKAELAVSSVRALAGAGATPEFSYHASYLTDAFGGANAVGQMLFGLATGGSALDVDFSKAADKAGALLTPNFSLSGLSRAFGPAAGDAAHLADMAQGKFDPQKFFGALDAKLFGVIDLWDIINSIAGAAGEPNFLDQVPKFISQQLDVVEALMDDIQNFQKALGSIALSGEDLLSELLDFVNHITGAVGDAISNPGDTTKLNQAKADIDAFQTTINGLPAQIEALADNAIGSGVKKDLLNRAKSIASVITSGASELKLALEAFIKAEELIKDQKIRLEWSPRVKQWPDTEPIFEPHDPDHTFILSAEIRAKASQGKPAGADLVCSLENFDVNLIGKGDFYFLTIPFEHIRFSIEAGKKPDIDVKMKGIGFEGVLKFVETLASLIPGDGFSDPPALTVDETGIAASFSVAIPDVAVGVFALTNMSLGARFKVPFIGDPLSVSFNFCTRENPFLLTVMMIGGGGFFGITLTPKGVQILEVQFEAGAQLALNFGVASGSVSVTVGIYFKMEGDKCTLEGFFEIHGEVEVLGGLAGASLTLHLALTYISEGNKLIGSADLEIEVHVLFFSASVHVHCERKLAGSGGDPTFEQVMAPEPGFTPWDDYVLAFAA